MPTTLRLRQVTQIRCTPTAAFERLCKLDDYEQWLPNTGIYRGCVKTSDGGVGIGTTYEDRNRAMLFKGTITEYSRPRRITFDQSGRIRIGLMMVPVRIVIRYSISKTTKGCKLVRDYRLEGGRLLMMGSRFARSTIRRENRRIIKTLKDSLERG